MTDARGRRSNSSRRRRKSRKRVRRRRFLIFLAEVLGLVLLLGGFYVVSKWDQIQHVNLTPENIARNTDMDASYVDEISEGYVNIGLFGIDSENNSDFIIICSINEATGEIRLSSLYRDMMTLMGDGTYNKINQGINHGSYKGKERGINEMNVINTNLDLSLEHYVMVDWTAVATVINWLGGVDVEITEEMMLEINGYITNTVENLDGIIGSHQLTHAGYQHLDGPQTIAYCRLRHLDSDMGRTSRQRDVLAQLFAKMQTMDISTLMGIADGIFPSITTTMSLNEVLAMAGDFGKYKLGGMQGFPYYQQSIENWREAGDWPMFATSLENNVIQLHEFLYGTQNYVPSATVRQISQKLDELSGLPASETTALSAE